MNKELALAIPKEAWRGWTDACRVFLGAYFEATKPLALVKRKMQEEQLRNKVSILNYRMPWLLRLLP